MMRKQIMLNFVLQQTIQIHYNNLNTSMSSFIKSVKKKISTFDLFPSPVLLRYNTEQMVQSKTGGIISLLIIILMIAAFYNSWLSMLNKTTITSNTEIIRQNSPSPTKMDNQQFLFAISLEMFNILLPFEQKYLDIQVTREVRNNGVSTVHQTIQLVPCQRQHFCAFGQQYGKIFDQLILNQSACLPYNFSINLQGKWGSQNFQYLRIHVKRCQSSDPYCKSDADLQNFLAQNNVFYVDYFFFNKLINPTLIDPVSTFFTDKYFNMINDKIAIDTNLYLTQYQINTDQSLLPTEVLNTLRGLLIDDNQKQEFIHPASNGSYAQFHIRKSDKKIKINRKFIKLDQLLSYLGGLFGIIITAFGCVISKYNKCCFQLQMCRKVFKTAKQNQNSQQNWQSSNKICQQTQQNQCQGSKEEKQTETNFNLWIFFKYSMYNFVSQICPNIYWKSMHFLNQQFEQTQNQMNVDTLLQKISFYQRALQCVFDQEQIMLLLLQDKLSIKQLKQQRILMNFEQQMITETNLNKFTKKTKVPVRLRQKRASIELQNLSNTERKRKSNLTIHHLSQIQFNEKDLENGQRIKQVYKAIQTTLKKSKQGDLVCTKILEGLRQDIMDKFSKDNHIQEKSVVDRSPNKFVAIFQDPPFQNLMERQIKKKNGGMKIDFQDLSEQL